MRNLVIRSQFVNLALTQAEQLGKLPNCKGGFSSFQIIDHVDPFLTTMPYFTTLEAANGPSFFGRLLTGSRFGKVTPANSVFDS